MVVVGISGGSGSGKSILAENLAKHFSWLRTLVLSQDSYYRDNSHLPLEARKTINFDHPDAIDYDLMILHLDALIRGEPVERPCYSFHLCTRTGETELIHPPELLLMEGILLFCNPSLLSAMHVKIFLDTPADLRLRRILERDALNRGRTEEEVTRRFFSVVQPMHEKFVEPCRNPADIILDNQGSLDELTKMAALTITEKAGLNPVS
ncbi:MAG: uridine kinase [Bacteroidales bacterium]